MRRLLTVIAGTALVLGGAASVAAGTAAAEPVLPVVPGVDDDGYAGIGDHAKQHEMREIPPPSCGPGNTFIVINGFCLRTS